MKIFSHITHKRISKFFSIISVLLTCAVLFSNQLLNAQPLASGKSKFIGNIIGNNFRSDFTKYWNQVTAENAGKWGSVEYTAGNYNWTQLDTIYRYALANNFPYKHHCLIWGNQQPSFMSSLDSAQQYQEIENWIKETGKRYPDADMCDVVNEPLPNHAPPAYKNALGGNGATGWDWVIKAFELARKYWSPKTKLLLNDYGILNSSSNTKTYLTIINLLKDRNLIDGIGCQGHGFENTSAATIKSNLDQLAATGLPVYISEFDLNIADDAQQKAKYQELFPTMYEHPAVKGITLWGYAENETWKPYTFLVTTRRSERPALQWLRTYLNSPFKPILVFPIGTTDESLTPTLIWHPSDSAKTYNVQVSTDRNFTAIVADTTVTDTLVQLKTLNENTVYYWHVNAANDNGTSDYTSTTTFITKKITDVNGSENIPAKFELSQNYPNPFNPTTVIGYQLSVAGWVTLKIYDVLGREVATLIDEYQQAGRYNIQLSTNHLPAGSPRFAVGAGRQGYQLSTGVYFYRLTAENYSITRKMILQK